MSYVVNTSEEFQTWFTEQAEDVQDKIIFTVRLLSEYGPNLRRPYADTLEGTSISNLKELRVAHQSNPYRILFAFDPKREALLLIAGNKAGNKRWYKDMIPKAEEIFRRHLAELLKEDKNAN